MGCWEPVWGRVTDSSSQGIEMDLTRSGMWGVWTGSSWLRIGTSVNAVMNLRVP